MGKTDRKGGSENYMTGSIEKRQEKVKQELLECLRKTPIVQIACQKLGIARATYYRWRAADENFAKNADKAIDDGSFLVNDMAESQLLSAIKDQNMTAIIFWLKHHHPNYATKIELTGQLKHDYKLSEEEEKLIEQALLMLNKNQEE